MTEQKLLDDAADFAYQELEKVDGDPLRLAPVLQPVVILYHVQAMIDNGGFRYIFENDFPFTPPYFVFSAAYQKIGANEAADLLDKVVAMFPFESPHLKQADRNAFMDSLDESHEFFALGDKACGDEQVWLLLEEYVRNSREGFTL